MDETTRQPSLPEQSRPPAKRSRANTAGDAITSDQELDARERQELELWEAELAQKEKWLEFREAELARDKELHARELSLWHQEQELQKLKIDNDKEIQAIQASTAAITKAVATYKALPSMLIEASQKFPGVDPAYIKKVFNNTLEPLEIINFRTGAFVPNTFGNDISLWAHCFLRYVRIYGFLFPERPHMIPAMLDFAEHMCELAIRYTTNSVVQFATIRMSRCFFFAHKAEFWREVNSEFEWDFFRPHWQNYKNGVAPHLTGRKARKRAARKPL